MKKTSLLLPFFLPAVFLLFPMPQSFAAEVFYFAGEGGGATEENECYPFFTRINDLFDFTSQRPLAERSGQIHGSVLTQAEYSKVGGNKSKSFLNDGWNYLTDVNLSLQEKLKGNYNLEGQLMMRKTDNPRVEPRRDVRVKDYQLKIMNPQNLFLFGDFYGELSQFTLGTSLEGAMVEVMATDAFSAKFIAARKNGPDEAAQVYQRNVFGSKLDVFLFRESALFSNARVGFQAVTNQDDSSSLTRTASLTDLNNNVFALDGEFSLVRFFSLNYEFARSSYAADEDAVGNDTSYANAVQIVPQLQLGKTQIRYNYNYTQPDFYTDSGSAMPDKIQHQTTVNHYFSQRASLSLMHNYYWDHLTGSTRTKRTINNEKSLSFNFLPLEARKTLRARVSTSLRLRDSDDPTNSLESETLTMGFGVNDRWNDTDVGMSYEYRAFKNEVDGSASEYFNRLGLSLAREYQVRARRLYLSLNPAMDIRRTKTASSDVNFSLALAGQYDPAENITARFGHNLIDSNKSGANRDFTNNRSFLEFDWALGEEKNTHLILRGDYNRYEHEDGTQEYNEKQAVLKLAKSF